MTNTRHGPGTIELARRWVWAVLAFWLVVAWLFPARVWLGVITGWGLLLGAAYLWARSLAHHVQWRRELRHSVLVVGDTLGEHFEVENGAPVPLLWAEVRDHSDVPGYTASRVEAVDAHSHKYWDTEGTCRQRGIFHLGPWEVITGDPLGLFRVRWHFPEERTVLIYPRVVHLPQITLPRGQASGRAHEWRPTYTEDITVASIRPYQPGDPMRRIHWPTTAHRGTLISRTFDVEPSGDVWIILDMDAEVQAGEGPTSTEEYAVILGASLAARMLAQGRSVGLAFAGAHPVVAAPRAGTGYLWELLGHLARARSDARTPLAHLLGHLTPVLGRGRTLVVITPSRGREWVARLVDLRRRGLAAALIWLDASTFDGQDPTAARGAPPFQDILAREGVPMHVITRDFPFHIALKIRRKRTEYRILPGTGRVIAVDVEEEV